MSFTSCAQHFGQVAAIIGASLGISGCSPYAWDGSLPDEQSTALHHQEPITLTMDAHKKQNGAFWSDGDCKMRKFNGEIIKVDHAAC